MGEQTPLLSSNIQKWRLRRGMSVSALARAADISKSTVSELERGHGNPSLDTLWSLAKSLNVPLGSLFVDSRVSSQVEVRRFSDAAVLAHSDGGHDARLLVGWQGKGEIEMALVTLEADARRDSAGNAPGVIEHAVCVEGVVEVGASDQSAVLNVGDLIVFAADQPHFYQAVGGTCRLLVVQQYPAA